MAPTSSSSAAAGICQGWRAIVAAGVLALGISQTPATGAESRAENEMPLVIKGLKTPTAHAFNRMTTSITLCAPGSRRCVSIDNIMVDTGSVGLRLQGRALAGFMLPAEQDGGHDVAECFSFVGHSNIWGKVRLADVHLGGLVASSLPVQVSDGALARPADASCPNYDNDPASNGTLGIGRGSMERIGILYTCEAGSCTKLPAGGVPDTLRIPNPVSRLPKDNNGEVFVFPPATHAVSREVHGKLYLGVNTAANNMLDRRVTILPLDARGYFTTRFHGRNYPQSYIDSGTQTISFLDPKLSKCSNTPFDYCTTNAVNVFGAMVQPTDKTSSMLSLFRIMQQPGIPGLLHDVYDDIVSVGGTPGQFVWGLPFFVEKRVYLVQEGRTPNGFLQTGPFYGFALYDGD